MVQRIPTRVLAGALVALGVAAAVMTALIPREEKLGELIKLVIFHGASTWVNLGTFTIAALLGLAFVVTGSAALSRWGSSFRYVSLGMWALNTVLGVISMRLAWGGFLWEEPRMRMTFYILGGALAVLAGDLLLERPRLTAALDVALGAALWTLILSTRKIFHPESPVLNSSGPIVWLFFGLVATIAVMAVLGATLVARRGSTEADA